MYNYKHGELKYELIYKLSGQVLNYQNYYPDNADPQWVLDHIIGHIQTAWLDQKSVGTHPAYIEFTASLNIIQFAHHINNENWMVYNFNQSAKYRWDIINQKPTTNKLVYINQKTLIPSSQIK